MRSAVCVLESLILLLVPCVTSCAKSVKIAFPRNAAAYVVATPSTKLEKRVVMRLTDYMSKVLGKRPIVEPALNRVPSGKPALVLTSRKGGSPIPVQVPSASEESYTLVTGSHSGHALAVCAALTDRGLKRAVQRLVILSQQEPDALVIPSTRLSESPWIRYREWTICPWDPEHVRGVFHNDSADKRMDIHRYSERRLADYVEMFDWFGFSGCQLMETCYVYGTMGSVEADQSWQKNVARFAKDNGQQVSLWAWTALFSGYGWHDPDVVATPGPGMSAFDDPGVRRSFEKYYDYYAELAPYVDRFIDHFYDPGVLKDRADVFKYMRLLEHKLKAKNPNIQMGIDCWAAAPDYLKLLADNGFKDYLILPSAFPEAYPGDSREKLHEQAKRQGMKLGIWGWYITEYETDQIASMYVNAQLMKDFYQRMRDGALKVCPVHYWSEMEAGHLNNIYSMYASSQLLWNPNRDPHEILRELTEGIWGPANGPKVLAALELIQDVRSGPTWETYWWGRATHRIGTDDPSTDLRRAQECISSLVSMKTDPSFVPKFPLPFPPSTFVELMIPHVRQIEAYAQFRLKVAAGRQAAASGADKGKLERMLVDAWQPVPEYNTWVGTFGSQELREQKMTVAALCGEYGLSVSDPAALRYVEADRLLQAIRSVQGGMSVSYVFSALQAAREFHWPEAGAKDRFAKLLSDGVVTRVGDDNYRLADWENWALR